MRLDIVAILHFISITINIICQCFGTHHPIFFIIIQLINSLLLSLTSLSLLQLTRDPSCPVKKELLLTMDAIDEKGSCRYDSCPLSYESTIGRIYE
jgi:hypothetical protein